MIRLHQHPEDHLIYRIGWLSFISSTKVGLTKDRTSFAFIGAGTSCLRSTSRKDARPKS